MLKCKPEVSTGKKDCASCPHYIGCIMRPEVDKKYWPKYEA